MNLRFAICSMLLLNLFGCNDSPNDTPTDFQEAAFKPLIEADERYLQAHQSVVTKAESHGGIAFAVSSGNNDGRGVLMINFSDNSEVDDSVLKDLLDDSPSLLYLRRTSVTDAGLSYLKNNPGLEVLALYDTNITDSGVQSIITLPAMKKLNLSKTKITDRGVIMLAKLPKLEDLRLGENEIGDAGVASLGRLKNLHILGLSRTDVTDACFATLKQFKDLEYLYLEDTNITDSGLKQLVNLKKLKDVQVSGTGVTNKGADLLRRAIPNCKVHLTPATPEETPNSE